MLVGITVTYERIRLPVFALLDAFWIHDRVAVQKRQVARLSCFEYIGFSRHVFDGGSLAKLVRLSRDTC